MGSMVGVLREECARLSSLEKRYLREVKKLPKGSIQIKRIKGIAYPYLVFRKGEKVISKYLGRCSENELRKLKKTIEQRKQYEKHLKQVEHNLKRVSKMIHGKNG
ncbi:MAG: hypothetical protein COV74_02130 [Candidatus Omnitrophica bacterium CG11_big_fil_rev_8_21_14_0_20_45_26]|uniref:DUF6788 domain-containing protein n=1 Tax=Candidatus Abzuiibacterium crystallinum TaxID=1974748 RepID=A0A2H0LRN6_9BACT|nr:MAG: hypothetical protein COV74_02130 [Candidatus Omnitrophica bacterium CG11_big_fil_rev_8_21_14_0_20_45_26]PIW64879.1 MAG: hypothetical protein COW12_04370 [Candidatus Omnitrophica bacterium CG12_big_fil_rev_8_21_14_0_65_45_16]